MSDLKHRTQISLDPWQYQLLLDVSRKSRKSLSALIREMVTERFAPSPEALSHDPLREIVGAGHSGHRQTARRHDDLLYRAK